MRRRSRRRKETCSLRSCIFCLLPLIQPDSQIAQDKGGEAVLSELLCRHCSSYALCDCVYWLAHLFAINVVYYLLYHVPVPKTG
ncbi:hypothetical protein OIU76_004998 [Salix suchowensis]|nr:hypothetical protein OIU76_004998 [Salix suchowensis]